MPAPLGHLAEELKLLQADINGPLYPKKPERGLRAIERVGREEFCARMKGGGKLIDLIRCLRRCELIATGGNGFSAVQREFVVSIVRAIIPRFLGVKAFKRSKAAIDETLRSYGMYTAVYHDEDWKTPRCEQRYFVWVQANRQVGKTTVAKVVMAALMLCGRGFRIIHVAHDVSFAIQNLADVKAIMQGYYGESVDAHTVINNQRHLVMKTMSWCIVKNSDPDRLRGQSPDAYFVDEASFMNDAVITRAILPVVSGNDGVCFVGFTTPNPDNEFSHELLTSGVGRNNGTMHHIQQSCAKCRSQGPEVAARCVHRLGQAVKPWNRNSRRGDALTALSKLSMMDYLIEQMGYTDSDDRPAFPWQFIEGFLRAPRLPVVATGGNINTIHPAGGIVHVAIDPCSKGSDDMAIIAACADSAGHTVIIGIASAGREVNTDEAKMAFIAEFLAGVSRVAYRPALRVLHTIIEGNLGTDSTNNLGKAISRWGNDNRIAVVHEAHLPGTADNATSIAGKAPMATVLGVSNTHETNKGRYIDSLTLLLRPTREQMTQKGPPLLRLAHDMHVRVPPGQTARSARNAELHKLVKQLRGFMQTHTTQHGYRAFSGKDKAKGKKDDYVMALALLAFYRMTAAPVAKRLLVTLVHLGNDTWRTMRASLSAGA